MRKLLVDALFVLVAVAVAAVLLFGLLFPALASARDAKVAKRKSAEVSGKSFYLSTEHHDGHMWILNRTMDYFVHHPDCPCRGKAEREER